MNFMGMFAKVHVALFVLVALFFTSNAWALNSVNYIDEKGEEKTITDYHVLTGNESSDDEIFRKGGWFLVNGDITYDQEKGSSFAFELQSDISDTTIKVGLDVHLILADNAKLNVINSTKGVSFRNLSIYAQSQGENQGQFILEMNKSSIEVNQSLNINGGSLTVDGDVYAGGVTLAGGDFKAGSYKGEVSIDIGLSYVDGEGKTYSADDYSKKIGVNGKNVAFTKLPCFIEGVLNQTEVKVGGSIFPIIFEFYGVSSITCENLPSGLWCQDFDKAIAITTGTVYNIEGDNGKIGIMGNIADSVKMGEYGYSIVAAMSDGEKIVISGTFSVENDAETKVKVVENEKQTVNAGDSIKPIVFKFENMNSKVIAGLPSETFTDSIDKCLAQGEPSLHGADGGRCHSA